MIPHAQMLEIVTDEARTGEVSAETGLLCSLPGLIKQLEAAAEMESAKARYFSFHRDTANNKHRAAAFREAAAMARRLHNSKDHKH